MKLPDQSSLFHSSANIITKSAVTFHDIKEEAVKDSFKKNKQAWETPPETTLSSRIQLPSTIHQTGSKKIQDFLYPEHLQQLRKKFETLPDFMNSTFDLDHFIEFFHTIPELKGKSDAEIKVFFDKIDCYSSGRINWDEFCTYMHLELYEREDAKIKAKEVVFNQPSSLLKSGPHKETICSISHLPDGSLVSCSEDGIICIWSHDFKPKRIRKTEVGVLGKPKWISDMVLAVPQGKIILATGDKEILFMELVNFEPYCQIVNLDSTPLKMDFWSDPNNKNECILIIGDEQGAVTIFCISSLFEFFKMLKLSPKKNGIPSFSVENFINKGDEPSVPGTKVYRWSLHANWVSSIKYCGKLRVFISTSNDPNTSLVMGTPSGSTPVDAILGSQYNRRISNKKYNIYSRQNTVYGNMPNTRSGNASIIAKKRLPGDQRVFKVTKGITTFDYCHINNVLVTGGMDQVIHIWNPFVNEKPIGSLYGQGSPLFHVQIDSPYNRIYSISNDNTVKVWDIVEYTCLATVTSICHKVYSTIEALHFNPIKQYLVLGTDQLHVLHLISLGNSNIHQYYITHTHRQPVTAIAYSQLFNLLITACEESVIKVWNLATGENIFEFASVHDNSPISAIDIDPTGRRLLTAAQNGEIKMWNYNNGHCLLKLDKGNNYEVTDIKFVSVNQLKYVIAVGWDRKLSVFFDSFEPGNVYTSITPVDGWKMSSGHSDDMTCVVQCTPTTLATASYDGEIIMWNILSGQITRRFKAPLNNNQLKSISPSNLHYDMHTATSNDDVCRERRLFDKETNIFGQEI
jgi:WD40 repeat protein